MKCKNKNRFASAAAEQQQRSNNNKKSAKQSKAKEGAKAAQEFLLLSVCVARVCVCVRPFCDCVRETYGPVAAASSLPKRKGSSSSSRKRQLLLFSLPTAGAAGICFWRPKRRIRIAKANLFTNK